MRLSQLATLTFPCRLGAFIGIILVLWLPLALPIYLLSGQAPGVGLGLMLLLYGGLLGWIGIWGQQVHLKYQVYKYYGLERSLGNLLALLVGLGTGVGVILLLFTSAAAWGWLSWQPLPANFYQLVLSGLGLGLAVALAEELLFRGWLLDELERDYSARRALWLSSLIFAIAHYLKPLAELLPLVPQFLGLVLLGLNLVWAKRLWQGRLGMAVGLHAGLVWGYYAINVGNLVVYSGQVPAWVTGLGNNPLAGLWGLSCLSLLLGVQILLYRRGQPITQTLL